MGKASRRKGKENKRPLDPSQMPAPFVARPFEGLAGETDWVAMREIVPSATAKVTFEVDGQEHEAVIATILPMAWPGLRREDGDMMVALQTGGGSGDASRDVALLQLQDAAGLATITPDRDVVSAGDTLTAMGNASGGGELVAASGQVTALNQKVTVDDGNGGTETLTGVIETNAGAVPGDSGGPMFDSEGEVTGMTTAGSQTVTRDPGGMRGAGRSMPITTVSYAVPISDALAVVDQIRSGTETATTRIGAKAYLGITVAPAAGVWVNSVLADGPAAEAGLVAGSTITSLDGQAVVSQSDLAELLAQLEPGQQVTLTWVDPSGSRRSGTIALGTSQVN